MTTIDLRAAVFESIRRVAPDAELDGVRADVPLRDQLDLDSFDWLQVMVGIHERTGVSVPERDLARLVTLNDLLAYLGPAPGRAAEVRS